VYKKERKDREERDEEGILEKAMSWHSARGLFLKKKVKGKKNKLKEEEMRRNVTKTLGA